MFREVDTGNGDGTLQPYAASILVESGDELIGQYRSSPDGLLTLELPPARYRLRFSDLHVGDADTASVDVAAGQTVRTRLVLRTAAVAPPG